MKKLSANVCAFTHEGRVRKENEDNYSLNGKHTGSEGGIKKGAAYVQKVSEPFHLSVCDGMGGESHGELASSIAVSTIVENAQKVYDSGDDFAYAISTLLDEANTKICSEISRVGKRMGTTLAAVYAVKGKLICTSLGDTRIYHFHNGILQQASFDHTHAQGIIDSGAVSADEISTIPDAKRLTKHLGVLPGEGSLQPNISVIDDVDNGDVILLCSDGLTDMLSDDDISSIVASADTPQDVTSKLAKMALERGGKDNLTVLVAFMETEDNAVFAPIAKAMVGGKAPDYEEEYRESYGTTEAAEGQSPYVNADATAYEKPVDKKKILTIVGIAVGVLLVLAVAVLIIVQAKKNGTKNETTTTSLDDYYGLYTTVEPTASVTLETSTTEEVTLPSDESSTDNSSTDNSSVFPNTTIPTKKNYGSGEGIVTKKPTTNTTKRPSSTGNGGNNTTATTKNNDTSSGTTASTSATTTEDTTREKDINGGGNGATRPPQTQATEATQAPTEATQPSNEAPSDAQ